MSDLIATAIASTWIESALAALGRARRVLPDSRVLSVSIVAVDGPTYGDPDRITGYLATVTIRATKEADA